MQTVPIPMGSGRPIGLCRYVWDDRLGVPEWRTKGFEGARTPPDHTT